MNKRILLFLTLFVFFNCKNKKTEIDKVLTKENVILLEISEKTSGSKIEVNELIGDLFFISLENNSESFITRVSKVLCLDEKIIIFDDIQNKIVVFNKEGKYLRNIGKIGSAPGEFTNVTDVSLDRKDKLLYVISIDERKINKYDIEGNFKGSFKIKDPYYYIEILDNQYIGYYVGYFSEDFFNLVIKDMDNNDVDRLFSYPKNNEEPYMKFSFTGFLTTYQNQFLYSDASSSHIYKVLPNDSISLKYKFNFDKDNWSEKDKFKHSTFFKKVQRGQLSFLEKFLENDDALIYNYNYSVSDKPNTPPVNIKLGVFYKKEEKNYSHFNFKKDDYLYNMITNIRGKTNDGYFISSTTNFHINEMNLSHNNHLLEKKIKELNIQFEEEQTILIYYKFK